MKVTSPLAQSCTKGEFQGVFVGNQPTPMLRATGAVKKFKSQFPSPLRGGEGPGVRGPCTPLRFGTGGRRRTLQAGIGGVQVGCGIPLTPNPSPALGRGEPRFSRASIFSQPPPMEGIFMGVIRALK